MWPQLPALTENLRFCACCVSLYCITQVGDIFRDHRSEKGNQKPYVSDTYVHPEECPFYLIPFLSLDSTEEHNLFLIPILQNGGNDDDFLK